MQNFTFINVAFTNNYGVVCKQVRNFIWHYFNYFFGVSNPESSVASPVGQTK